MRRYQLCFLLGLAGLLAGGFLPAQAADEETSESSGPAIQGSPASGDSARASRRPPPITDLAVAPASTPSATDLATLQRGIAFARQRSLSAASDLIGAITEPIARKLLEWTILRNDDGSIPLSRHLAFMQGNPSWPGLGTLRRRAEGVLWDERQDAATVRAFFKAQDPLTTKGRFALARALLSDGDRQAATATVRDAWRRDPFPRDLEARAMDAFGTLLTPADHKARMDQRLYDNDEDAALRTAERLGAAETAIAKARIAVSKRAADAGALLDAVPAEGHGDAGYIFSRTQWLRRQDKLAEAAELIQTAPRDPDLIVDLDEWWIERRLLARTLLDKGEAKTAYVVARDAVPPPGYRSEHQFTAGWIALRFLNDPAAALDHFKKVGEGTVHPMTLGRAGYWQGRAYETMGQQAEARAQYEAAARHSTAYYGQLARAKLGMTGLELRGPRNASPERRAALGKLEIVRAVEMLYELDQRELIAPIMADLGERATDAEALMVLGEIAERNNDARAMLLVGRAALTRGLPLDHAAFPTVGLPPYTTNSQKVAPATVYAIMRQESAFNPTAVSSAKAMGLMQVTPDAAKTIARRINTAFDEKRLLSDPAYNMQFGAAEIGSLLTENRGSYILAFTGYNAGRGRVKEWIRKYGDPRLPKVDPVDWVERIPFAETRNYVQRVIENMQIYRARLDGTTRLTIEADLRRGGKAK